MPRNLQGMNKFFLLTSLIVVAAGCASYPAPMVQMQASQNAIDRAVESGAADAAGSDLSRAREKQLLSQRWVAARDNEPARWLAEQAEVDAELARARAAAAGAVRTAAFLQDEVRVLKLARGPL